MVMCNVSPRFQAVRSPDHVFDPPGPVSYCIASAQVPSSLIKNMSDLSIALIGATPVFFTHASTCVPLDLGTAVIISMLVLILSAACLCASTTDWLLRLTEGAIVMMTITAAVTAAITNRAVTITLSNTVLLRGWVSGLRFGRQMLSYI